MRVPMLLRNCKFKLLSYHYQLTRKCSNEVSCKIEADKYIGDPNLIEFCPSWRSDEAPELRAMVLRDMRVIPDFVSMEEEAAMLAKLEPQLKRMRYEFDHWDNAIEGYRETERECSAAAWGREGAAVLARVRNAAFGTPAAGEPLPRVHVLDLAPTGHIKPHVDAVRFCGPVIAGLCLNSAAVMKLAHAEAARAHLAADALLPRRCLYIMTGVCRYQFTHAVGGGAAGGGDAGGQQAALQRKLLDSSPDTLQQQESLSISGQSARHLVMQRLMRRRASRTVLLCNMVAPDEVDEALHHEIQEECSKWGQVERLVIYNERQSEDDDPAHATVKIFVQFAQPEEAAATASALNGRYFGGRTVRAALYDQDLFDHGDLSA